MELRRHGIVVAALTNNFTPPQSNAGTDPEDVTGVKALFDHFIESRLIGMRKPDPRIYQYTLDMVLACLG